MKSVSAFLDIKSCWFPVKKCWGRRAQGVCYVIYMRPGSSLGNVQLCTKFYQCGICKTDFMKGGLFSRLIPSQPPPPVYPPLHSWVVSKRPILNRINTSTSPYIFGLLTISSWYIFTILTSQEHLFPIIALDDCFLVF